MMSPQVKLVTICETFNHEAFIMDALRGFVTQTTSFPFISIIIDDASTDQTATIIRQFFYEQFNTDDKSIAYEKNLRFGDVLFARHQINSNCYFAIVLLKNNHYSQRKSKEPYIQHWMNNAEYIATCEGDDYWTDSDKLQKQVDFLDLHDEYVMCCTAFTQTVDGNELSKELIVYDKEEITIKDILQGIWIGTLTVVYRKDATKDYRVPFPDILMRDLPRWCHLALKGRIKYFKQATSNYRRLSNSASHLNDERKQYIFNMSAMKVREYYALQSGNRDVVVDSFAKAAHFYLSRCYINKWFDFPLKLLWHFLSEYSHPSGYDRIRYWGLKGPFNHSLSVAILSALGK